MNALFWQLSGMIVAFSALAFFIHWKLGKREVQQLIFGYAAIAVLGILAALLVKNLSPFVLFSIGAAMYVLSGWNILNGILKKKD